MSMRCEKLKMIEKSIKKMMHRMRRACIDAKNAKSNFFDLIKICQEIKSINMRKNQIFSIFLDRVFALQNRNIIWLHNTFFRNDTMWLYNCICIIRFFETILFEREHLDQYIFSKLYCLIDCFSFILATVFVFFFSYLSSNWNLKNNKEKNDIDNQSC